MTAVYHLAGSFMLSMLLVSACLFIAYIVTSIIIHIQWRKGRYKC